MTRLTHNQRQWLFGLLLLLTTLAVFWPVHQNAFINYDDDDYIYANDMVRGGLTWAGLNWAFMGVHAVNWHPVTWLSHMLDCQLFGVNPGAHHLMNVLIHGINAALLLGLLTSLTGKFWRGLFVAALFALHPLRVESVAWAAERKDVLCSFFCLLTLLMYVRHARVQTQASRAQPGIELRLSLLFFLLALLSKPMAVTLPVVMLLLDWWPLGRFADGQLRAVAPAKSNPLLSNLRGQLHEKWPFFFLSAVFCGITLYVQHNILPAQPGNTVSLAKNMVLEYLGYIQIILWPQGLSFLYLQPQHISGLHIFGAVLVLAAISTWALVQLRRRPWAAVGWLWFLVMLLPVTTVQLPALFIANRYTYLPGIGFFILLVWSLAEIKEKLPAQRAATIVASLLAVAVLVVCANQTRAELGYWRNTQTLLERALQLDPDNTVAQVNLRVYLFEQAHPGFREKRTSRPAGFTAPTNTTNQPASSTTP